MTAEVEHQSAHRFGRIELLRDADEGNTLALEHFERFAECVSNEASNKLRIDEVDGCPHD